MGQVCERSREQIQPNQGEGTNPAVRQERATERYTPARMKQRNRNSISGETPLLQRIERAVAGREMQQRGALLGIGDDAALWKPVPGRHAILTCDWFLEGTHFLRDKHPPDSVGWKCLARAVSDVAAMGGAPRCFLLSLALPTSHTGRWLDAFLRGLRQASRRFECLLVGGDTTRQSRILLNVTVLGEAPRGYALLRSGARPGDALFVSGRLGGAELGLRLMRKRRAVTHSRDPLLRKHLYPEPRLALGQWLAEKRVASAMMDLSDGMSTDLPRLCAASAVGARVEAQKIPVVRSLGKPVLDASTLLNLALNGGDDYELLFAVPRNKIKRVPRSFHGIPLTRIGEITTGANLLLQDSKGYERLLASLGWDRFRQSHRSE